MTPMNAVYAPGAIGAPRTSPPRDPGQVQRQDFAVDKEARAGLKGQKPCVVWLTGLSGAGKSTIADIVDRRLHAAGYHTCVLDGDNLRLGLNRDLGFGPADRAENIRRVAEVARLMVDAGLIAIVSSISPFRAERRMARQLFAEGEFLEIFVDTPLAVAEARDTKGLYQRARRGELPHFTGIGSPYQTPEQPALRIDTTRVSPEQAADAVVACLDLLPTARRLPYLSLGPESARQAAQ